MYNESENDPISSGNKKKVPKVLLFICVIIIIIFGSIILLISSLKSYADVDYVEINNVQIPTLYKYTQYDDVFITRKISNLVEGNFKGSYVVLFFNQAIPTEYKDIYINELDKLQYENVVYNGTEFYVKNIENNTNFIYIMISNLQIKYGICTSGRYENILK